jgi:hypothetical protein
MRMLLRHGKRSLWRGNLTGMNQCPQNRQAPSQ